MRSDTCVHVPQSAHTHARVAAHVVLSVWMCVRGYMYVTNARVRVCVYMYLYQTCTHWHRHAYTQYTYITCMERDTCVHVPWFIQTHTWVAAHAVLFVWMCVLLYMCITMRMCVCVYVSVSHIYTLTQIHHTQYTYTKYMQRDTRVHVPQFIRTRAWAVTHVVFLYGSVYVCLCVTNVRVHVCVYTYLYHTCTYWNRHA